jgi:hypothetical protein
MVTIGSGAQRALSNIRLSRQACSLIVQNGDPSKPVIAKGRPVSPSRPGAGNCATTPPSRVSPKTTGA